jgi:hypothetical protein
MSDSLQVLEEFVRSEGLEALIDFRSCIVLPSESAGDPPTEESLSDESIELHFRGALSFLFLMSIVCRNWRLQ